MDSITQVTIGCAIGELCLGRQLGNRAILWGGLVGTLADLDFLANPLFDEVTRLTWHRGYSHSILINLVAAPLLAWLMHRLYRDRTHFKQWLVFMLMALQAAIWIDAFTVYTTPAGARPLPSSCASSSARSRNRRVVCTRIMPAPSAKRPAR
jgi:inner membrane protein